MRWRISPNTTSGRYGSDRHLGDVHHRQDKQEVACPLHGIVDVAGQPRQQDFANGRDLIRDVLFRVLTGRRDRRDDPAVRWQPIEHEIALDVGERDGLPGLRRQRRERLFVGERRRSGPVAALVRVPRSSKGSRGSEGPRGSEGALVSPTARCGQPAESLPAVRRRLAALVAALRTDRRRAAIAGVVGVVAAGPASRQAGGGTRRATARVGGEPHSDPRGQGDWRPTPLPGCGPERCSRSQRNSFAPARQPAAPIEGAPACGTPPCRDRRRSPSPE